MNNKLDNLIQDVGEETFEALAYMLPMPPDEEPVAETPAVAATVAFQGPFAGTLAVSIGRDMLDELVGNMLGVMDPDELSDAHRFDALKELLNVICGNLLPKLAGQEAVFDVMAPDLAPDGLPQHIDGRDPVGVAALELDTGRAHLALFAETGVPAIAALSA